MFFMRAQPEAANMARNTSSRALRNRVARRVMGRPGRGGREAGIIAASPAQPAATTESEPTPMTDQHDDAHEDGDAARGAPRGAQVPDAMAGRRFDAVLAELFPEYSRSRLAAWVKSGDVLLDGATVRPRESVRGGQEILLTATLETQVRAEPEDIPLTVLHEDAEVLVIDKPAGLVVHPGAGNHSGTLVNALLFRDPALAAVPRAGIV